MRRKLNESDLHRIVKESVKKVLKENSGIPEIQQLKEILCNLDEHTAESVANEIAYSMFNGYDFNEMVQRLSEIMNPNPYSD